MRRCPNLVALDVSETRVTGDGLTLFLHTHPNAVSVEHQDTVLAFRRLPCGGAEKQQSALAKLTCSDCSLLSDDALDAAVANCRRVESVSLTNAAPPGIGNESLYRLMTMRHLRELHLGNYDGGGQSAPGCAINFYEGVAPVLETCGAALKKLVLENIPEVDVAVIGEKCGGLLKLALSGTTMYKAVAKRDPDHFSHLISLELWDDFQCCCSQTFKQCGKIHCR